MTADDSGHPEPHNRKKIHRCLFPALVALISAILLSLLLIWLVLRPAKPHFALHDASVYAFNLSSPNFLTTNLQITLSSRNPNERIGIYYDRIDIYASYHNQRITLTARLPGGYQGHKDITVWSPFLYGTALPVARHLSAALEQDEMAGTVRVNIRVDGRVRWKVGTFVSGKYHLYVNCPAYIHFENVSNNNNGVVVGSVMKYPLIMDCQVDV
ncbi:hypothetical protein OROGR_027637 [Orobanche gracilis]